MNYDHSRLLMRAVHGELNRWGKWHEARIDYQGYPQANILETYIGGGRAGEPGHKVLMLEMPVDVYAVDARVVRLPEELRRAVWVVFVFTLKFDADGKPYDTWTFDEKCEAIGVSTSRMGRLITRAKRLIAGLDGGLNCQVVSVLKSA